MRFPCTLETLLQPLELLRQVLLVGLPQLLDLVLHRALFRVDGRCFLQRGHDFLPCLGQNLLGPRQLPADRFGCVLLGLQESLQLCQLLQYGGALVHRILEAFSGLVPVSPQVLQLCREFLRLLQGCRSRSPLLFAGQAKRLHLVVHLVSIQSGGLRQGPGPLRICQGGLQALHELSGLLALLVQLPAQGVSRLRSAHVLLSNLLQGALGFIDPRPVLLQLLSQLPCGGLGGIAGAVGLPKLTLQLLAHSLQLCLQSHPTVLLRQEILLGSMQTLRGVFPRLPLSIQGLSQFLVLRLGGLEGLQRVLSLL